MLNQGRTKTFSELNRLNLKEFLNELNIGFHKDGFLMVKFSEIINTDSIRVHRTVRESICTP